MWHVKRDENEQRRETTREITRNFDKLHKIGKTDKKCTQNTSITFKTHSFKESSFEENLIENSFARYKKWRGSGKICYWERFF